MGNKKEVYLVSSGDLRLAANQVCWDAQQKMEMALAKAIVTQGWSIRRAHQYDPLKKHGFIDSQKMGIKVFRDIDPDTPLIVAESLWQYSHHVLAGLITHRAPILTVANWSGQWPGLVGMLNLNGSLTKANVDYSTLWSEAFDDRYFLDRLQSWLNTGKVTHDLSHVRSFKGISIPEADRRTGELFARKFKSDKKIIGVFDEGCMGMFNAIIPDNMLHRTGVFKERLSQSSLYAEMLKTSDVEAEEVLGWLLKKGMKFNWGSDETTELTRAQSLIQCKMYIAATRIADEFGCDAIGIQYQQGLKDLTPTSDLAEGLLNNDDRPPVLARDGRELYAKKALPHFNEVDECAGLDGLLTYHLWNELGMPGENTLHDIRWGETLTVNGKEEFVWVLLISGAAPPEHFVGGYAGTSSERQPPMYFRLGGGSVKGVSKPGFIVWSRVFVEGEQLHCDLGLGEVVSLSGEENNRRWNQTTPQWPIMNAVLKGVSRDQLMARHKANHIHVVYATDEAAARRGCLVKAAAMAELGINVSICGDVQ